MATATFTSTIRANTAVIKQLHDALLAVGLVQTSDTGQLNLGTASPAFVATNSLVYGYNIYRWTDAAQSAHPIFLRLEWRNGASSPHPVYPVLTVGQGSDGAGNLTGTTATSGLPGGNSGTDTGTWSCFVSYVEGALSVSLAPGAPTANLRFFFAVDRLRDLAGVAVGGFLLTNPSLFGSTAQLRDTVWSPERTAAATSDHGNSATAANVPIYFVPFPSSWATETSGLLAVNDDVPFFPAYVLTPSARTTLGQLVVPTPEMPLGTEFSVNRFGQARTYRSLGAGTQALGYLGAGKYNIAMAWE